MKLNYREKQLHASTEEFVEVFNDHFSTIGPRLAESIPNDNDVNFRDFITQ
jgi:hypothetical protein